MATVGRLNVILSAQVRGLLRGLKKSQSAMESTRATMQNLAATSAKVAIGFGAVTTAVVASSARFEKSMTRAAAVAAGSEQAFSSSFMKMETAALQLAGSTEFTATEVSDGMEKVAVAGNNATQVIAAMPSVLQLATASGVGLAQSADTITNIMAGFGITTEKTTALLKKQTGQIPSATAVISKMKDELKNTNNVLVATFTGSNTTLTDLGEAFKTAGPVAKLFGRDIDEVAASLGVLGNAGIQGSEAGTGLKRALTAMAGATPKARKAMEELGLKTTDVAKKGIPFVVKQLQVARKQFAAVGKDTEFTAKLFEIFGDRAGPKMGALVEQGVESLVKLQARIAVMKDENIAEFLQTKQLSTFSGAVDLATSAIDAFSKSIGKELRAALRPAVVAVQKLFSWLAELPQPMQKFIAWMLIGTTVIAAVVALMATMTAMGIGLALSIKGASVAYIFLAGSITKATTAILGFMSAVAPALIAIVLMATLIAFVVQTVREGGGEFKKFGKLLVAPFKDAGKAVAGFAEMAAEAFPVVAEGMVTAIDGLKSFAQGLWTFISALVGGFVDMFAVIFNVIVDLAGRGLSAVATQTVSIATTIGDALSTVWGFVEDSFGGMFEGMQATLKMVGGGLLDGFGKLGEGFSMIFGGIGKSWSDVWNGIKKVATGIARVVVTIVDAMVGAFIEGLLLIPTAFTRVREFLAKSMDEIFKSEAGAKILGALGVDVDEARKWSSFIRDGTKDAAENVAQLKRDLKSSASLGEALDTIESVSGGVVEFAFDIFDPTDFINTLKRGFKDAFAGMSEEAKAAAGVDGDAVQKRIDDLMKKMMAALGKTRDIKAPTGTGGELTDAQKAQINATRELIKVIQQEKMARARSLGFGELDSLAARFKNTSERIRELGFTTGDFVSAAQAAKELKNTQEALAADFINSIKNSKEREAALDAVREHADQLGVSFENVKDKINKLDFDEITAEFGPSLNDVINRGLFESLSNSDLGFGPELTKGLSTILSDEVSSGLMGGGMSLGSMVGAGIGAAFGSPQVGAAIGSALEAALLGALSAVKGAILDAADAIASVTGDSRLQKATGAATENMIGAAIGGAVALYVLQGAINSMIVLASILSAGWLALNIVTGGLINVVAIVVVGLVALATAIALLAAAVVVGLLAPVLLLGAALTGLVGLFTFIASLAMQSDAVVRFQQALGVAVDVLMKAFEPLEQVLMPLAGLFLFVLGTIEPFVKSFVAGLVNSKEAIFDFAKNAAIAMGNFVLGMAHTANALVDVVQFMAPAFLGLADTLIVFGTIVAGVGGALLHIVELIAGLAGPAGAEIRDGAAAMRATLHSTANEMPRDARDMLEGMLANLGDVDTDAITNAIAAIAQLTIDEAEMAGAALAAGAETQEELNEVLSNIPQGFKVARERFEAIIPGFGNTVNPGADDDAAVGGDRIDIAQLVVLADDPEAFLEALKRVTKQQNQEQTGSTRGNGFQGGGSF